MEIILYIHVYSEPMVEMGVNLSISNIVTAGTFEP